MEIRNMSKADTCSCPADDDPKCEDYETLEIMEKFRKFYENKLKEIDVEGGGDCLELKLQIQQRWISDLTEQTQMMARIVRELETEATDRVQMLEDKLKESSKSAYEVMKRYQNYNYTHNLDEHFQANLHLESDVRNLLEFIRRIREDDKWSSEGLQFYDVARDDLFGRPQNGDNYDDQKDVSEILPNKFDQSSRNKTLRMTLEILENLPVKDDTIKYDETLMKKFSEQIKALENLDDITDQLKRKEHECEKLKQSMFDVRASLTEEVACKHDLISALKRDLHQMEERCVQADKQTAFKDDIIKELRKETKLLKQQQEKDAEIKKLQKQLDDAKELIKKMRPCVDMNTAACMAEDELSKALEQECDQKSQKIDDLECRCTELEHCLANANGRGENLQKAVDLYLNSINLLETSEERAKLEIEQQRVTIANLQDALVNAKQALDEFRARAQQDVSVGWAARWFGAATPAPNDPSSVHDV